MKCKVIPFHDGEVKCAAKSTYFRDTVSCVLASRLKSAIVLHVLLSRAL